MIIPFFKKNILHETIHTNSLVDTRSLINTKPIKPLL